MEFQKVFEKLLSFYGPQKWWPADSPFEVCVGAILTQNTNWQNVEKAIQNLKEQGVLNFDALKDVPFATLSLWIQPSGYYKQKAKRLLLFLNQIAKQFGHFDELFDLSDKDLRQFLMSQKGIGPETCDSIMLYAFERTTFVVDAYTHRIFSRHQLIPQESSYFEIQDFLESHVEHSSKIYNEYHALIVKLGKDYCKKSKPKCEECPLLSINGGPDLEGF